MQKYSLHLSMNDLALRQTILNLRFTFAVHRYLVDYAFFPTLFTSGHSAFWQRHRSDNIASSLLRVWVVLLYRSLHHVAHAIEIFIKYWFIRPCCIEGKSKQFSAGVSFFCVVFWSSGWNSAYNYGRYCVKLCHIYHCFCKTLFRDACESGNLLFYHHRHILYIHGEKFWLTTWWTMISDIK